MAVSLNLIYVIGVIDQKVWCWPAGILGSLLSIYLFIDVKLYSESILYLFYVLFGIYGWYKWTHPDFSKKALLVTTRSITWHLGFILSGILLSVSLGFGFHHFSDANNPYEDAFSTIFSFIATYFEAHKILSTWVYWIILNAFSVYLYHIRGLEIYGTLMIVYFLLSIVGLVQWWWSYRKSLQPKEDIS